MYGFNPTNAAIWDAERCNECACFWKDFNSSRWYSDDDDASFGSMHNDAPVVVSVVDLQEIEDVEVSFVKSIATALHASFKALEAVIIAAAAKQAE